MEAKKEIKTEARKETRSDPRHEGKREKGKGPDNEVRVKVDTYIRSYLAYIARLFDEKQDQVIVRGMGAAIASAVRVATLVRCRFKGIHQIAELGTMEMDDRFERQYESERGKRRVPYVKFLLSKKELDKNNIGYMPPLPDSEVTEYKPYVRPEGPPAERGTEAPVRRPRGGEGRPRRSTRGYGRGYGRDYGYGQRYEQDYDQGYYPRRGRPYAEEEYHPRDSGYEYPRRRSRGGPRRSQTYRPREGQ
jgi:DNA-binding protein